MFRATGPCGRLRVGYQTAAELGAWEIIMRPRVPATYQLTSTLKNEHPYWMTQRPLDLVLELGSTEWLWRDVTVEHLTRNAVCIELQDRPLVSARGVLVGQGA